jgi:hypothetical protein
MESSKRDGSQKARSWIPRVPSISILVVEVVRKVSDQTSCMSWAISSLVITSR